MQLESLRDMDQSTANAILAATALVQAGSPYPSPAVEKYSEQIENVLQEIRGQVNAHSGEEEEIRAVRKILSDLVLKAVMADTDIASVTDQLGMRGELPISSYKVVFEKGLLRKTKENENFIRRAIASCRDVQHIVPDGLPKDLGVKGVSLLAIAQETKRGVPHWILVDAMRAKDRLSVSNIFRVFPDAVDLRQASTPLDMLKAFAERYGVEFQLEGGLAAKFHGQHSFPKSESDLNIEFVLEGDKSEVAVSGTTLKELDEELEIVLSTTCHVILAYSYNWDLYLKDRRRFLGQ